MTKPSGYRANVHAGLDTAGGEVVPELVRGNAHTYRFPGIVQSRPGVMLHSLKNSVGAINEKLTGGFYKWNGSRDMALRDPNVERVRSKIHVAGFDVLRFVNPHS